VSARLSGEAFLAVPREAPWDFGALQALRARLDAWAAGAFERLAPHYRCAGGCHHCCRRIGSLLPVEWAFLQAAGAMERQGESGLESELHPGERLCGLLDGEGRCRAYEARPVICRTHGHALLLSDDEGDSVDFCPWNFEAAEELEEDDLIRLDSLHEDLLRANAQFLKASYPSRMQELWPYRIEWQADEAPGEVA
jgi:Fe-S-cluster containining protein